MSDDRKLAVFDLDGTLIRTNSFHRWMLFAAGWSLYHGRAMIVIRILWAGLLRVAGIINHATMKRAILAATRVLPQPVVERFAAGLIKAVNADVHRYLLGYLQDPEYDVVLITAAPEIYVEPLALRLGVQKFIATSVDVDAPGWHEMVAEHKVARLAQLAGRTAAALTIDVVFTDHHQDLPLLKLALRRYLVSPSDGTRAAMAQAGLADYVVIGPQRA